MGKERLEKAKLMAEMLRVETRLPHDFPFDLVDWLVEQAEQKQSLETAVDFYQSALRDADRRVQELEEENKRQQEALEEIEEHAVWGMFTNKYVIMARKGLGLLEVGNRNE